MSATDAKEWRTVYAQEAVSFAIGKTIKSMVAGRFDSETVTWFTDGSAMRVTWERGTVYSEYSSDPDEVRIEILDATSPL